MKKMNIKNLTENLILIICSLIFFANANIITKALKILIYLLFIVTLFYIINFKSKNIKINKINIKWIIALTYLFFGIFISYNPQETIKMIKFYLLFFPIIFCEISEKKIEGYFEVLKKIIIIGAISIIISLFIDNFILKYFSFFITANPLRVALELGGSTYSGLFSEKGNAAFMLNIGLAIVGADVMSSKKINLKKIFEIILFLFTLILTNKRALLIFPVLIFIVIYMFTKDKYKILKLLKYLLIGGIVIFSIIKFSSINLRVFDRLINDDDNHRTELKQNAILMYKEKPIFGMGLNTYNQYSFDIGFRLQLNGATENGVWTYHAHNVYYQLLGETGIIGIIIILIALLTPIYHGLMLLRKNKISDSTKKILIISLYIQILFVIYGYTGNTFYYYQQILIYFIALSITNLLINKEGVKNEKNRNTNISSCA
jgi:O-antigen ligase